MGRHTHDDLIQLQSLPLSQKIQMTKNRIREWYDYWQGDVYVSFSGGKDSTVLKHIVDEMCDDVPSVFVNTGLEYPEIQKFVLDVKAGKFDCFNTDVEIIRPEMRFDEVITKYGYPVVSKQIADAIEGARRNPTGSRMLRLTGAYGNRRDGKPSKFDCPKWKFMLDAPFKVSAKCCDVMKKDTFKAYGKSTGRKPILGTLASESQVRKHEWEKHGCNAFDAKSVSSRPLSFWTEDDIWEYLKSNDVPYSAVYDSGVDRTGCMFCMFGCHLEKEPNRFQRMKVTHPKQYEYCMNALGLKKVLEYIGVPYE